MAPKTYMTKWINIAYICSRNLSAHYILKWRHHITAIHPDCWLPRLHSSAKTFNSLEDTSLPPSLPPAFTLSELLCLSPAINNSAESIPIHPIMLLVQRNLVKYSTVHSNRVQKHIFASWCLFSPFVCFSNLHQLALCLSTLCDMWDMTYQLTHGKSNVTCDTWGWWTFSKISGPLLSQFGSEGDLKILGKG